MLYDFQAYKQKREAALLAGNVLAVKARLGEPGAILEVKSGFQQWLALHETPSPSNLYEIKIHSNRKRPSS